MITMVIDAMEERDVMITDIPNAFMETPIPDLDEDDRVTMKITGVLVERLLNIVPGFYKEYVVYENGRKTLYKRMIMAIYGMLQAAPLWYNKFRKDLEGLGFKFNSYDPCVAN